MELPGTLPYHQPHKMVSINLSKEEIQMILGLMNTSTVQINQAEKATMVYKKFLAAEKV